MSNEAERGNGSVPVQYHQFDISDEDGPTGPDLGRGHNGLVRVTDGVTAVMTGIHTGDVDVTVTLHGPGDYRLRIHARGLDTAVDLAPDEVTEWYLLQAWPGAHPRGPGASSDRRLWGVSPRSLSSGTASIPRVELPAREMPDHPFRVMPPAPQPASLKVHAVTARKGA